MLSFYNIFLDEFSPYLVRRSLCVRRFVDIILWPLQVTSAQEIFPLLLYYTLFGLRLCGNAARVG